MKAKDVLQQMNEIEQTVHATQSWWPQLRRLLEQAEAAEASQLTPVAADVAYCPDCKEPLVTVGYCIHCERSVTPSR